MYRVRILGIDDPYLNLSCIQIKNAGAMAEAGKVNLGKPLCLNFYCLENEQFTKSEVKKLPLYQAWHFWRTFYRYPLNRV